jgi:hypothetical protein
VIAVIGNITVIHRIWFTYQQTRQRDLVTISEAEKQEIVTDVNIIG